MPNESVADRVASEIMATYSINRKTLEITEVTNDELEAMEQNPELNAQDCDGFSDDWLRSRGLEYDDEMEAWMCFLPQTNGKRYPLFYDGNNWHIGETVLTPQYESTRPSESLERYGQQKQHQWNEKARAAYEAGFKACGDGVARDSGPVESGDLCGEMWDLGWLLKSSRLDAESYREDALRYRYMREKSGFASEKLDADIDAERQKVQR
jgi:hypothetical protein